MVDHNDVPRQNETQESSAQVESERVLKAVQACKFIAAALTILCHYRSIFQLHIVWILSSFLPNYHSSLGNLYFLCCFNQNISSNVFAIITKLVPNCQFSISLR